ncbi:hypothetical protein OIU74_006337 [Salix koriyanagi]|uniref:Uncharacterized protein n=1 Tax=Salix koriyanagi TaxID=2511006 RepID=A0A9Q0UDW9_9ROSI|nr:hypothetical protein OIU74_006337 [Salix koriyanagi]
MSAAADPAEEKDAKDEVRWRFKPRQLDITWGGDSQYWKMPAWECRTHRGNSNQREISDIIDFRPQASSLVIHANAPAVKPCLCQS